MQQLNPELLSTFKSRVEKIVSNLYEITNSINHNELEQTVRDLKIRITEPFMFVIVGEVKAGKSSFINALLGTKEDICKVAPSPMTDTIQQIVYGDTHTETVISPHLKRITFPEEILKEIVVVDTPGTNTIIEHHQEITKSFIPASDLIVFVFEAKNPYRQSAWDFLDFIHDEWRKKIIFILQQKDLMESDDLITNEEGVKSQAEKKGINNPKIFSVSAKQERNDLKEESGFARLRSYISDNITGGQAPVLKLQNNITTAENINNRIFKGLVTRKEQYESDMRFRNDIRETLDIQKTKSAKQVDQLIEHLVSSYNTITEKKYKELDQGVSFLPMISRSFKSIFNSEASPKEWLNQLAKNFEKELNYTLKDKLNDGVVNIAESIQQMGKMVSMKIRESETILKDNHDIFSDIAERRANVLKDLQSSFSRFLEKSENFYDEQLASHGSSMAPNLAAGGGIAVVGVILAAVTNGMVFDITGGILTTVGLLFAGVTVGLKRKKILTGFRTEIDKGRESIQDEVSSKLKDYIETIKDRIEDNFFIFDQHLEKENAIIQNLEEQILHIDQQLKTIAVELENTISKT